MKTLIIAISCFFSANVFSQNITNTLGTGGLFTIKDATTNYLTLSQSTGDVNILKSLQLENTTASIRGVIYKDGVSFLHNYGISNTFLGEYSGNFTMTGYQNTAIGYSSLPVNTSGHENTALGYTSLYSNTTGSDNTALGYGTLGANTSGYSNTAVGFAPLRFNISGDSNTAVGNQSLFYNTGGNSNTALGNSSLRSNTSGSLNTAVGLSSLSSNTTGIINTALGYSTGSTITTGGNLTCLGYNAEPTSGTAINQITLGNSSITSLRCNVTTITSLSDVRDKRKVGDLTLGLEFLMKVKPRLFNWDKREWYENNISDGSKMNEEPTAGFIAQELAEVQTNENAEWLNLVLKDNPEKLEATYGNLLPVIVKAIQDLKAENDQLKQNNNKLSVEIDLLKLTNEKIVKLEQMVKELNPIKHTSLTEINLK